MYALVIGRAYPSETTGMMGIFEFEQAKALNNYGCEAVYAFCDTRSIKSLQKFGYYNIVSNSVKVYGYHLPIKGLPQKIFSNIKKKCYKKILDKIITIKGVPDIIHVHFPLLTLSEEIWELLKDLKRPIVVTEHWTKVQIKNLEPFRITLLKQIVEESAEFICVGEQLKKSVVDLTNTNRNIMVIPNMVSSEFYYEKPDMEGLNKFNFVSVGRLMEVKRFNHVIEAFTLAFKGNKEAQLTIVGDGLLYNKLKRQIKDLDMNNQIQLTGFLSRKETAKLIKRSNALVSASVLETFGVPFIEAMACGKPIIGIKNGPIDIYIDESNGILFEQENVEDLARALKQMYAEMESYDNKKIADRAYELFSEEAIAKCLKKTYEELINS
ncbi:glycosyltransferase [Bacillus sp. B15-48]|uniref:glycosyltransferase n=1 Tax=Bacillus sp. B15-48 TaxID=1548601 RepID=UPI00193F4F84|nr:glycosyltransferase [Bacillus sp. B15-48]MBM4761460.1 glycosyltransferase [Bacillus sp. B15-48]